MGFERITWGFSCLMFSTGFRLWFLNYGTSLFACGSQNYIEIWSTFNLCYRGQTV